MCVYQSSSLQTHAKESLVRVQLCVNFSPTQLVCDMLCASAIVGSLFKDKMDPFRSMCYGLAAA